MLRTDIPSSCARSVAVTGGLRAQQAEQIEQAAGSRHRMLLAGTRLARSVRRDSVVGADLIAGRTSLICGPLTHLEQLPMQRLLPVRGLSPLPSRPSVSSERRR
ncbi:hypothetical protein [Sphingomonas guangdongensis]|uniref:hypothetical protein n=1 Tax=Sphingomonas guangdongensis TaxID=1141890 RepID=UPI001FE7F90E|nr:hypothetical protein [Sphingomonas guangdongensis]